MKSHMHTTRRAEAGFTLVELAVVMVIIGILIGGILKGQELITNARVTSTISSTEAMAGAYNGFRDKYQAIPGDMINAQARLTGCTGAPCVNGSGNNIIATNVGGASVAGGEGQLFFVHLLRGEFITGMDGTAPISFGTTNPTAPIGGGFLAGDVRTGVTGFTAAEVTGTYNITVAGNVAGAGVNNGILLPQQAATLDRRLDDGAPITGSVIVDSQAGCRVAGPPVVYSGVTNITCSVSYRL